MAGSPADEATTSLWMSQVKIDIPRKSLTDNVQCDVAVVGSGMAGLSVAYELARAGKSVVVVERGAIVGGITARTTAHLTPICDDGVAALIKLRGEEVAMLFQESQTAAVNRIEEIVEQHAISCNFRRLPAFLFPAHGMDFADARKTQDDELKALKTVGADVEHAKGVPLRGYEQAPVLRYADQATFHPLRYAKALIGVLIDRGVRFYPDTPVVDINEGPDGITLVTEAGREVQAAYVVLATNSPINDLAQIHSKLAPYRTYAMAFTIPKGALPDALYWDMADPYHYVRQNPGPGKTNYLIAGGADHKSGEANDGDVRFEAVEAWIRALVPKLGKEVARWSGQVLDTIDYCGFIGRNPGNERVFIVTGDSGQGMTHGALAGLLLKDQILGVENPWRAVYDPARKPVASLGNLLRENVSAVKNIAERILPGEIKSSAELRPGEGGIRRSGLDLIATCMDRDGRLHEHSAICTHMGCVVHWNRTEQCWDCPCHGSHFGPDGAVLNGPATKPLPVL